MPTSSEFSFVRVEISSNLQIALAKLLSLSESAALSCDEQWEVAALRLQIQLALWRQNRKPACAC
jgi:hypothetical protein